MDATINTDIDHHFLRGRFFWSSRDFSLVVFYGLIGIFGMYMTWIDGIEGLMAHRRGTVIVIFTPIVVAMALAAVWRWLDPVARHSEYAVSVGPTGVWDRRATRREIKWAEVSGLRITIGKEPIVFDVRDTGEFDSIARRANWVVRGVKRIKRENRFQLRVDGFGLQSRFSTLQRVTHAFAVLHPSIDVKVEPWETAR